MVTVDDLLEGRLRARERLRDQAGFGDRLQVNRNGEVLCKPYVVMPECVSLQCHT
jgi:hypothetical protein